MKYIQAGALTRAPSISTRHLSRAFAKRAFDVTVASGILLFTAPLLVVIALLVKRDGGPAFYGHERVGHGGKRFKCWKFRSMVLDGDRVLETHLRENEAARLEWNDRRKLTHDPRITRIGRFLRKTSLDELPQLFNILRGEMSLVGPRPVTADELQRYRRYSRDYMSCIPGVTGLWQVSGRSNTSYRRRVALDTTYARRQCSSMDAYILLATVPAVLLAKGAA